MTKTTTPVPFDLGAHTFLITGATSGIGLALAERLLAAGAKVIAVGRRQPLLDDLLARYPDAAAAGRLAARRADVADAAERAALASWVTAEHPDFSVLLNNAGVQRFITDLGAQEDWTATWGEVETNLGGVIHLTRLLLPHLRARAAASSAAGGGAAVVNVSSGLSFVPKIDTPVYCATKAAVHSFTLSLREQERQRGSGSGGGGGGGAAVRVIEIVPPAVNTDLGGPGLHDFGAPLDAFADSVIKDLAAGEDAIYFGFSGHLAAAAPGGEQWQKAFAIINALGK